MCNLEGKVNATVLLWHLIKMHKELKKPGNKYLHCCTSCCLIFVLFSCVSNNCNQSTCLFVCRSCLKKASEVACLLRSGHLTVALQGESCDLRPRLVLFNPFIIQGTSLSLRLPQGSNEVGYIPGTSTLHCTDMHTVNRPSYNMLLHTVRLGWWKETRIIK